MTYEELQYEEQQEYALQYALDCGDAMPCEKCGLPQYMGDLTCINHKLLCEDCVMDLDDEPDEDAEAS